MPPLIDDFTSETQQAAYADAILKENVGAMRVFEDKGVKLSQDAVTELLFAAAQQGKNFAVTKAVELGANVNATQPRSGNTALHLAVGYPTIMDFLLSKDADPNEKNNKGESPSRLQ